MEQTDWEKVRIQAAIATMQGYRSQLFYNDYCNTEIAKRACLQADALIKELKEEE